MNLGYKCIKSYNSQMRLIGAKTYVLIPQIGRAHV